MTLLYENCLAGPGANLRRRLRDASERRRRRGTDDHAGERLLTGSDNNYTNGLGCHMGIERS